MKNKVSLREAIKDSEHVRIRLFRSPFLERLSYVHPITPFVCYLPFVVYFTIESFVSYELGLHVFLPYFLAGLFFWTFAEYTLHRFLFHPPQINYFFKRMYFYIHGLHHDAIKDATRLVMPLAVSIPLAVGSYYGFMYVLDGLFLPAFIGFMVGYLLYDFLHFASHFMTFPYGWFKTIKKNHMRHHHSANDKNFGFTSPLWDILFGTYLKVGEGVGGAGKGTHEEISGNTKTKK